MEPKRLIFVAQWWWQSLLYPISRGECFRFHIYHFTSKLHVRRYSENGIAFCIQLPQRHLNLQMLWISHPPLMVQDPNKMGQWLPRGLIDRTRRQWNESGLTIWKENIFSLIISSRKMKGESYKLGWDEKWRGLGGE